MSNAVTYKYCSICKLVFITAAGSSISHTRDSELRHAYKYSISLTDRLKSIGDGNL